MKIRILLTITSVVFTTVAAFAQIPHPDDALQPAQVASIIAFLRSVAAK